MFARSLAGWLGRAEEIIGTILLALIFLAIAVQVLARFILRDPPFWTEELARYLFVWMVCVGSAEVVRCRAHITMDVLALALGPRLWSMLQVVFNLAMAAILVVLAWYGLKGAVRSSAVASVALGVPESFLYGALPVGAALMAIRLVGLAALDIAGLRGGRTETKTGGVW